MKKSLFIILALVLAAASFSQALAATPAPGGPFSTAFYIQNLTAVDETCSYSFYTSTGTVAYASATFSVAKNANYEIYTPSISGLTSGSYSGVISCDQKSEAIVNFSDADSAGSHNGISTPAATWYIPNLYNNYYSYYSNVYVQNTTGAPVNVTLEIYGPDPGNPNNSIKVYTSTKTNVPASASVVFDQVGVAQLLANKPYSGKIIATGNVAPIVNYYGGPGNVQLYTYNPFVNGTTKAYVPALYSNYYGYNTEMRVQNVGGATANVTITYSNGQTANVTIQQNSGKSFYTPNILPAGKTLYSAVVTSDQPIVVVVNESNAGNQAATYNGLAVGSTTVNIPAIMKNYYGYNTDVTCMNMGNVNTNVTITYKILGNAGVFQTTKTGIAAGRLVNFYTPTDTALVSPVTTNKKISAIVTSSGQPVNCIVNESHSTNPGDVLYSYNAFALIP